MSRLLQRALAFIVAALGLVFGVAASGVAASGVAAGDREWEKGEYKVVLTSIKAIDQGKKVGFSGTYSCPSGDVDEILFDFNPPDGDRAQGGAGWDVKPRAVTCPASGATFDIEGSSSPSGCMEDGKSGLLQIRFANSKSFSDAGDVILHKGKYGDQVTLDSGDGCKK
ncbi:hypothetical protein [Streptomyces sirii]|uniref:hypothetical protein n=1 Tax=Streptomyces sirii TaxID=3127701 RepID=UPI003D368495